MDHEQIVWLLAQNLSRTYAKVVFPMDIPIFMLHHHHRGIQNRVHLDVSPPKPHLYRYLSDGIRHDRIYMYIYIDILHLEF